MRPRAVAALVALVAAVAAPAASADVITGRVLADVQADGKLEPCTFPDAQLEQALRGLPPDIARHAPDVKAAIRSALQAQSGRPCASRQSGGSASGGASPLTAPGGSSSGGAAPGRAPGATATNPEAPATTPTAATTPTTPGPATTAPATTVPVPTPTVAAPAATPSRPTPASRGGHTGGGGPSAALIVLAALGLLVLLGAALAGTGWALGWDPAWVARLRHTWGEAAYRAGGTGADFMDWLRLGR